MTTIELIYFNAGGGHRAAAQALQAVIRQQQRPWRVRCVNLVDMLDPQGQFRRLFGMPPEDIYNLQLAKGWTLGLSFELKLLQGLIRLGHCHLVHRLQRHWQQARPDMVVSLVPNFNRALGLGLAGALPGVPFVTVLTDLADHPPHFWIEPGATQYLVCGSDMAVRQALAAGIDPGHVFRSSGMIIRPDFYRPPAVQRRAEQQRLGLDPERPTGVVMFGAQGSMAMLQIARQLDDVQLLLLCGHHHALAAKLRALRSRAAHAVVGFTPDVCQHLQLGDFFIGKPGPGSLSEAVQQGLPLITLRNAWTLPQERPNTDWVRSKGLGLVVRSWRDIRPAVQALLAQLDAFRENVQCVDNRAVFKVPEILARILATNPPRGVRATRPGQPPPALQATPSEAARELAMR
jgi:UDP-N-acetylglucosamine:LPS N-acetylglucosamine transferase